MTYEDLAQPRPQPRVRMMASLTKSIHFSLDYPDALAELRDRIEAMGGPSSWGSGSQRHGGGMRQARVEELKGLAGFR